MKNTWWVSHKSHWPGRKETSITHWPRRKIRIRSKIMKWLVMRKICEFVSNHWKTSPSPFTRKKSPSCNHSICHLLHPSLFTTFVLKPYLKFKNGIMTNFVIVNTVRTYRYNRLPIVLVLFDVLFNLEFIKCNIFV